MSYANDHVVIMDFGTLLLRRSIHGKRFYGNLSLDNHRFSCIYNNMIKTVSDEPEFEAIVSRIAQECIAVRLRILNRVVTNTYDEALRPLGLTIGQLNLLVRIEMLKNPRQNELGQTLFMEKSTLSRNIERLRKKQWITIHENSEDKSSRLRVTKAGRALILKLQPSWEGAQKQTLKLIGTNVEQELRTVVKDLRKSALAE